MIIADDDNIYDSDLDFVIEYAQRNENKNRIDAELSVAICMILKDMSFLQRAVLFDSINYEIDYKNKEEFDAFYDHDKESLERVFESYDWDSREKLQ